MSVPPRDRICQNICRSQALYSHQILPKVGLFAQMDSDEMNCAKKKKEKKMDKINLTDSDSELDMDTTPAHDSQISPQSTRERENH